MDACDSAKNLVEKFVKFFVDNHQKYKLQCKCKEREGRCILASPQNEIDISKPFDYLTLND